MAKWHEPVAGEAIQVLAYDEECGEECIRDAVYLGPETREEPGWLPMEGARIRFEDGTEAFANLDSEVWVMDEDGAWGTRLTGMQGQR